MGQRVPSTQYSVLSTHFPSLLPHLREELLEPRPLPQGVEIGLLDQVLHAEPLFEVAGGVGRLQLSECFRLQRMKRPA